MLTLYCLDALDDFKSVFDVDYFQEHRSQYLAVYYRSRASLAGELAQFVTWKRFPFSVRVGALVVLAKRFGRKILRFGKPKIEFRPD